MHKTSIHGDLVSRYMLNNLIRPLPVPKYTFTGGGGGWLDYATIKLISVPSWAEIGTRTELGNMQHSTT